MNFAGNNIDFNGYDEYAFSEFSFCDSLGAYIEENRVTNWYFLQIGTLFRL